MVEDSYQLSPMQQGMLFHSLYAPQSGVDIEQMICDLHENLDVPSFEDAWQQVVERHTILRTSLSWEGLDKPLQKVHRHIKLPVEQQDWRDLSTEQQESRLEKFLQSDRQRGFNLAKAPLMRLSLFRLAEGDYQLIWTFHHSLLDGRSFPLVLKEVFAFYEAKRQGQNLWLEQPRPYRDYIKWLQQQNLSQAEAFWRQILKGFTAPTPLVVAPPSRGVPSLTEAHGREKIQLSEAATTALSSFAQEHDLTLNTLVQGAWSLLLSRYSGEEDVVFGATRAGRRSTLEGADSMIGNFINTLPVRVGVSPEMSVLPWLKQLRAEQIAVRKYERTPLLAIQGWSDVPQGTPLFESILVFENYLLNSILRAQGGGWEKREFRYMGQTNYPLTVIAYSGTGLILEISYDRHHFNNRTITRMLGHFKSLLEGMVADPKQRLSELPLLTDRERNQLLIDWNQTAADYPREKCVHQLFEEQVKRTPDAVAVVYEEKQLTYSELDRKANQLARYLQKLGVGPAVLVGICVERSLEMVVGLLGILKAGGAYVPLDPVYPPERLSFLLEDSRAPVLLTQERFRESLPVHEAQVVCLDADWEKVAREGIENLTGRATAEDLAYVIYTSGSTGRPKGVMIEHRSLVNHLCWVNECLLNDEVDSLPLVTGLFFDASLKQLFAPLLRGSKVWALPVELLTQPAAFLQALGTQAKVGINCIPSLWKTLLDAICSGQALIPTENLACIYIGGEQLSEELVNRTLGALPHIQIWNLYGPTEATVNASVARIVSASDVTIGRPIANTQIYILDSHLQPVPIGVAGELCIGGDGLARGYLDRPELTKEKFIPNPFSDYPTARLYRTGDLGRYLEDGKIEFLGRIDHQIKIRGYRVELGEVETVLTEHRSVREAVVVAREDEPGDKRLVAYVIPEWGATPSTSELRNYLKEKLPNYMVPSAFVVLDELPLTLNGKVDRQALPNPEGVRPELEAAYVAPRNEVERNIATVWQEVLHLDVVGIHDNFFDLGGNSLLTVQVHSRLRVLFDRDLSVIELFRYPTISDLASYLSRDTVEGLCFEQALDRAEIRRSSQRRQRQLRERGH